MGRGESVCAGTLHGGDERLDTVDTVDVPGVITEEDTTERGERAEQVGLPRHWSFDAANIAGGSERCAGGHAW